MSNETITEPPKLVAMVLCDTVIEDTPTGKKSLIGIFYNINITRLPSAHPSMSIWASFTGGRGKQKFKVRLMTPRGKTALVLTGEASFNDPLGITDIVFHIRGFPLEEAGEHHIDIWFGGTHAAHRPFQVTVQQNGALPHAPQIRPSKRR